MTWRDLLTQVLDKQARLDRHIEFRINASTLSGDHVLAKDVMLGVADDGTLYIDAFPATELFDGPYVESEKEATRFMVEREYEKAANDKAERETIEDLHCWLGKQIGV